MPQIFAISLQNGSGGHVLVHLPQLPRGATQFGVLRGDLTPRPGYLALAAAGRLLADAKPVGRLKSANKDFWGYLFRAKPDGKEQLLLVAWSMKGTETIRLPAAPVAMFDTIGRQQKPVETTLEVASAPVFGLFPVGLQNQFEYEPAPTLPPRGRKAFARGLAGRLAGREVEVQDFLASRFAVPDPRRRAGTHAHLRVQLRRKEGPGPVDCYGSAGVESGHPAGGRPSSPWSDVSSP